MRHAFTRAPCPALFSSLVLSLASACAVLDVAPDESQGNVPSRLSIWGGSRVNQEDPLAGTTVALIRANGFPFCTGTYLGGGVILTAAHCVSGLDSPLLYVSFDLEVPTEYDPVYGNRGAFSAQARRITRTLAHSAFDDRRFSTSNINREPSKPLYDIGLVFFEGAAPASARPVILVGPATELPTNADITLAGFGRSDADGGDYGRLYKVSTRVGDIRNRSLEIVDGPNLDKGSCIGDSGGPVLVGATPGGRPTVTGVVSYGPSNCESGTGFNTDLRFFRDWVITNMAASRPGSLPRSAIANDMSSFVPTADGSFYQMCRDRGAGRPEDSYTMEAVLQRFGTLDCQQAARLALNVRNLDLSHSAISSIRPLRHFIALEKLDLSYNEITELAPISFLSNLHQLNLVQAGIRWKDYHHPHSLEPWHGGGFFPLEHSPLPQGFSFQAVSEAPYTPGIWLTALRKLEVLVTERGATPDRTARFAQPAGR